MRPSAIIATVAFFIKVLMMMMMMMRADDDDDEGSAGRPILAVAFCDTNPLGI
jgi:hypothetical protein